MSCASRSKRPLTSTPASIRARPTGFSANPRRWKSFADTSARSTVRATRRASRSGPGRSRPRSVPTNSVPPRRDEAGQGDRAPSRASSDASPRSDRRSARRRELLRGRSMSRPKSLCQPALKRPPPSCVVEPRQEALVLGARVEDLALGAVPVLEVAVVPLDQHAARGRSRASAPATARCCGEPAPTAPVKRPPNGAPGAARQRPQLDHAAERVGAVGDRARTARHLDALERRPGRGRSRSGPTRRSAVTRAPSIRISVRPAASPRIAGTAAWPSEMVATPATFSSDWATCIGWRLRRSSAGTVVTPLAGGVFERGRRARHDHDRLLERRERSRSAGGPRRGSPPGWA